jgi:hypothetical protein
LWLHDKGWPCCEQKSWTLHVLMGKWWLNLYSIHTSLFIHIYMYMYIYKYMCVCLYIYVYIYVYLYMCVCMWLRFLYFSSLGQCSLRLSHMNYQGHWVKTKENNTCPIVWRYSDDMNLGNPMQKATSMFRLLASTPAWVCNSVIFTKKGWQTTEAIQRRKL